MSAGQPGGQEQAGGVLQSQETGERATDKTPAPKGRLGKWAEHLIHLVSRKSDHGALEQMAGSRTETIRQLTPTLLTQHIARGLSLDQEAMLTSTATETFERVTVEQRLRQDRRLSDALSTLLASFPEERRDELRQLFPDLDTGYDKLKYDLDGLLASSESEEQAALGAEIQLTDLLSRAVDVVGGVDNARILLQYPGVQIGEELQRVRPVQPELLKTSLEANTLAPQMALGIATKVGRAIVHDVLEGRATWNDEHFSYLSREQLVEERALVAKLHAAHRAEPHMPEGYTHPHMEAVIPDSRLQSVWRSEVGLTYFLVLAISHWAENAEQTTLPPFELNVFDLGDQLWIPPEAATRLRAFFKDPQFRPYINVMLQLYDSAAAALDSPEGLRLQKLQRDANNSRKPQRERTEDDEPEDSPEDQIHAFVGTALTKTTEEIRAKSAMGNKLPRNFAEGFTDLLSGNEASFGIDEYLSESEED